MKFAGYITLAEAEELSGIKADTLKKRCQDGRIRGAIKQGKTWFVPQDEVFVKAQEPPDIMILILNAMARSGVGMSASLLVKGHWISGNVMEVEDYLHEIKKINSKATATGETQQSEQAKIMAQGVNRVIEKVIEGVKEAKKADEELPNNFVHLRNVRIERGGSFMEMKDVPLRVRISSIDAFFPGVMEAE